MRPPWRGPGSAGPSGAMGWGEPPTQAMRRAWRGSGPGWSRRKWAPRLSVRRAAAAALSRATSRRLSVSGSVPSGRAASTSDASSRPSASRSTPTPRHIASWRAARTSRPPPAAAGRRHRGRRGALGPVVRVVGQGAHRAGGQHRGLQQPVGGEPVGPVRARGRALAHGEEARDRGAPLHVGQRAADGVVRGRGDRDRVARQVEPVLRAEGGHGGEAPEHQGRRRGGSCR